jgi:hypothetical protein
MISHLQDIPLRGFGKWIGNANFSGRALDVSHVVRDDETHSCFWDEVVRQAALHATTLDYKHIYTTARQSVCLPFSV